MRAARILVLLPAWIALCLGTVSARADSLEVVPPLSLPGPYPVACTDVAQDFSRLLPGEDVQDYWEGMPRGDGTPRYATDLLAEPSATLAATVNAPDDGEMFGRYSGRPWTNVVVVCYPTSAANTRADYPLPNGHVVPRMQRAGDAPILADGNARWPLVLFAHGYGGSPLSGDYVAVLQLIASEGYVTTGIFHGDFRFAVADIDDVFDVLSIFGDFTAMQALRPLAQSATLDMLAAHPDWRDRIDFDRVGAFGGSQGGQTQLLMAGAALTVSIGQSSRPVTNDPRLKAAVGYVPYFGWPILLPAFGRDQNGLEGLTLPYLALSGTADTTAPIAMVEQGLKRMKGTRSLVAFEGLEHRSEVPAADVFTWGFVFLDAHLRGNGVARAQLQRMASVIGGYPEARVIDYTAPAPPAADERIVVEYYNAALDHYFLTAEPAEAAMLDAGVIVPGWRRTGYDFKAWALGAAPGLAACRFFGTPGLGPNSHFYTIDANECAIVKANPGWTLEGLAFQANAPVAGDCPAGRMLVTRLYNNGKGGQANHRYLTSRSALADMLGQGWMVEGPVYCTPP